MVVGIRPEDNELQGIRMCKKNETHKKFSIDLFSNLRNIHSIKM